VDILGTHPDPMARLASDLGNRPERRVRLNDKEVDSWRILNRREKLLVERRRLSQRLIHLEIRADEKKACH
jgi:hypothetical protein